VRTLYWIWSMVMFVAIVVQIGFAGYGAFNAAGKLEDEGAVVNEETFGNGFDAHIVFGYLLVLLGLIFLVIGIAAGVGKWRLGRHGVLFLLFAFDTPYIGFFHPVNALALFSVSGWIAWDEWQRRKAVPSPAVAT
jgi:uncharacterized membrane protein YhaH (DUF805 family)